MSKIWILCSFLSMLCSYTFAQRTSLTYESSNEDIVNPERGFYRTYYAYANKYEALNAQELSSLRNGVVPFKDCPYKVNISIILRCFSLDGFQDKDLTQQLLDNIDNDFAIARKAGIKMIIRFGYKFAATPNYKPPYGDAPLARVKQHIAQLQPILRKNADVIAIAQLGFIGLWGEGYYSDYYGIPGTSSTGQNLRDRAQLLDAFLKALPAPLIVQVRHPTSKQDYQALIKNKTLAARIGFHNDAFLGPNDDMGTFKSQDMSAGGRARNSSAVLMSYVQSGSANTAMGGESAASNPPYDKCSAQGGQAENRLAMDHFSYLNSSYHRTVLTGWAPCIEDIKRKLGYRLVLESGAYSTRTRANDTFSIAISITNEGYAAPFNSKNVSLILYNQATKKAYSALLPVDVRSWSPGTQSLNAVFSLGSGVPEGKYDLLLGVADNNASLAKNPDFAIKFANKDVWRDDVIANDLHCTLTVAGQRSGSAIKTTSGKKKVLIIQ
ncbi:protein of unknown function [Chitinophaga sp. YR627]|uniref:DUF4832 domain-containing protein n=1 Tax=Chitinophaga sp. YR627 TaxID=1881041 RepID=UPI0008E1CF12|nr:DUF4832 domain-containing protein [Chitinophaga sp. YR627]SFN92053.1 protein of unknown function [Chitinophaga sp. YR627]